MIIYKITNLVNQKVYIGQTIYSLEQRWRGHCYESSNCRKLKNAIKFYGKESFSVEQIDFAENLESLNKKETHWIQFYNSVELGYNLNFGGDNKAHSEESKRKMSESRLGRKLSEKQKQALRDSNKGRKMTPEHKELLRSKNKGRPLSDDHKSKLSKLFKGRETSYKCKEALARYNLERKLKPELEAYRIKKMSESLIGRTRTEASKKNQRENRRKIELYKRSRGWKIPFSKIKKKLIQEVIALLKNISTL
jgi:group I intron endonuclease